MIALNPSDLREGVGIQIEVYNHDDLTSLTAEPVTMLPRHRNAMMMDELNGDGAGSFEIRVDDALLEEYPNLLKGEYVARMIHPGGGVVWFIMNRPQIVVVDEEDNRWHKVAGPSMLSWWDHAIVFPESPTSQYSSQPLPKRHFNFGNRYSTTPRFLYETDWDKTTPFNTSMSAATSGEWQYQKPEGWPSNMSSVAWVWDRNTNTSPAPGDGRILFMRGTFTTSAAHIRLFAAAQADTAVFYIDGIPIMTINDTEGEETTQTADVWLNSGTHIFAIKAQEYTTGWSKYGVRAALAKITISTNNTTGDTTEVITPLFYPHNSWPGDSDAWWLEIVSATGREPNWSAVDMFSKLHEEAKTRGVDYLKFMFMDTTDLMTSTARPKDADNITFTQHYPWSFDIGTTYREVLNQLIAIGYDVWMDQDTRQLKIAQRGRGLPSPANVEPTDKSWQTMSSKVVRLMPGYNIVKASADQEETRIVNRVLFNVEGNAYMYPTWSAGGESKEVFGMREGFISGDGSQRIELANALFAKQALPHRYPVVEIIPREGAVPFIDFGVGDWILAPEDENPRWASSQSDNLVWRRVMSITAEADDNAMKVKYSIELDAIRVERETQINARLRQLELRNETS